MLQFCFLVLQLREETTLDSNFQNLKKQKMRIIIKILKLQLSKNFVDSMKIWLNSPNMFLDIYSQPKFWKIQLNFFEIKNLADLTKSVL